MENIGRKLTNKGMASIKKLDTNKNGKLDVDEVDLGDGSDGDDYNVNIGQCTYCQITQCMGAGSCVNSGFGMPVPYPPYSGYRGFRFPWGK